jgi:hypothetical protein
MKAKMTTRTGQPDKRMECDLMRNNRFDSATLGTALTSLMPQQGNCEPTLGARLLFWPGSRALPELARQTDAKLEVS